MDLKYKKKGYKREKRKNIIMKKNGSKRRKKNQRNHVEK